MKKGDLKGRVVVIDCNSVGCWQGLLGQDVPTFEAWKISVGLAKKTLSWRATSMTNLFQAAVKVAYRLGLTPIALCSQRYFLDHKTDNVKVIQMHVP